MRFIGVERSRVTGSQLQRRGGFPRVGEAVEPFEALDATVDAELGEEAAAADALELAWVTDQGEPPAVRVGEGDQLVEGGRRDHAGLVHDKRRAGRQLELG